MKKTPRKTGDYGIGIMIHSVHMTDDVPALNRFYEEVFGGLMYMGVDEPNYLPVEDRLEGTLAATAVSAWLGARVFRAHHVRQTRRVLDMVAAIRGERQPAVSRRGLT